MQDSIKYDVGIIGGGPGGYTAAFEAAKNGLRVVLFESDRLGGTCLNRGCIPTKYLSHVAKMYSDSIAADKYGLSLRNEGIDFRKLQNKKVEIVDSIQKILRNSLLSSKIDIIPCKAVLDTPGIIICGTEEYRADSVIIATGAVVSEPFADGFFNSDGILELEHLPETMKIVGGGTIAVEFAQIFSRFGVDVRLQIRADRILRKWNREVSVSVAKLLRDKGVKIETKCEEDRLKRLDAEICLSATGVRPCLSGLNSDLFELGKFGGIITDEFGRTKSKKIYAVGDVTEGSTQLAHHAMEEGKRAVWHILGKKIPEKPSVIRCIYVCPEVAEVGYTEEQARIENLQYETVKVPLYSNSMNMIFGGERAYIRLVADKGAGILIGAQLMCERASDIISELALAINAKIPISDICKSLRPHPSFSESISEAFGLLKEKMI